MSQFEVIGGARLSGEILPQGAKNEALQVISAVLLTDEEVLIRNIPDILDVNRLVELLQDMGVRVEKRNANEYSFIARTINRQYLQSDAFQKKAGTLRGSIMVAGPLLARVGEAYMPKPGGDKIGRRKLDTHFLGFEKLGATLMYDEGRRIFRLAAKQLRGTSMLLDEASVTGTANIVMAAVLAEGQTTIYNAACEPYVQQLCRMLNGMGARITGIGSNLLTIEGVSRLHGTEHRLLPDMIEIGSFIGLAAMTESTITIKDVAYDQLGMIPTVFERLGIALERRGDDILVNGQQPYEIDTFMDGSILTIADAVWPGFTPDLLSIVLVTAIQAKGTVLVHQKMFESRLFFVDRLIEMGAQIILCDPHRAAVVGLARQSRLRGTVMNSPDIRAGIALLIAALSAEGKSTIGNIEQIDRGYSSIDARLNALGAHIVRLA